MSAAGTVLVTGATGTQGGAVLRGVLDRGDRPVAALVRDPAAPKATALAELGVELRRGDLSDPASLAAAFAGVDAVYAVTTPFGDGPEAEVAQGEAIVAAAEQAGLPWLVLASVAAADRADVPHFVSKARIERRLAASSVPWTVVAPSYFYENVAGAARAAAESGRLAMPLPADVPLHQVALADLAAVVAAVLARRDEHLGVRVEVAGDAPTPAQMAAALHASYEEQPLAEVRARSADLGAMYAFLAGEGYGIDVAAVRARYPEVPWRTFASWAAERV
ncbi:NmrA family NAD(P)-binding protein [Patulibacter sp.]|uniref:NmrA family NAD(P)-binding protein n=1 Tax=Patulibacter sp. TaxID=1912859 RepID=UPI002721043E|nr:NmrA family NAD(P)-binding protein [Patulibacter sp.]MDO9409803.1 NmrA family NAD(P)-binding protein [Patulibacter sp.]